jgi:hypothetical protein
LGQEATFHIDHVTPVAEGGRTAPENLALACVSCSLRKGARIEAIDPKTRQSFPLFNPRTENWSDHFQWQGLRIKGISGTGRATVELLNLNRLLILAIRKEEQLLGRSLD